jgi:hypothetical protein
MVTFSPALPDTASLGDAGHVSDHNSIVAGLNKLNGEKVDYGSFTAKGTLVIGSAANAVGTLTVGTNNQVLIADSAQALGVKWGQLPETGLADSAVTTNKIADSAVTSVKIANGTITGTDIAGLTITAANIANDTITSAQIAADAVGSSEIAAGAVGTSELADAAVTSAKIADGTITSTDVAASTFAAFSTVGNLLTPNQAQPTTTGAYSLLGLTENTPGAFTVTDSIVAAIAYHPVTVGHTYTLKAKWSSDSPMSVVAQWQDALGVTIRNDYGTSRSGANVASEVTSVAPPGAVQMAAHIVFSVEASVGSAVTIHESSFHRGAGGTFSMPGVPITGQSHIATNGAVHLSGTGTPEGVITAAPGSTWLQTDSTTDVKGWIRWVKATGTGNTGWVAGPEADTGWRDVTADLLNGWASSSGGRLVIRRVGSRIELTGGYPGITGASKTNDVFYNPPSGFQETATTFGNYALMGHALKQNGGNTVVSGLARESTSGINMVGAATDWTAVTVLAWWTTPDAWPSSLPGSAA